MRDYELVYIISPEISAEDIEKITQKVAGLIEGNGGEVTETQAWGRKRLAYPIQDFREGYYVALKLRMKPEATRELERSLKLTEGVIRYLLVTVGA
ncbi:MAG: 30S ribosomal protein S6 [Chloroflexi bacterium]|nr:30S ribosomal protein S6 [Chloroflexota bacterium]